MAFTIKAMDAKNQSNLKAVKSGAKIHYLYSTLRVDNKATSIVLIGSGHDAEVVKVISAATHFSGDIEVLREPLKGKGELRVTDCGSNRSQFDGVMARVSKKKVFYV